MSRDAEKAATGVYWQHHLSLYGKSVEELTREIRESRAFIEAWKRREQTALQALKEMLSPEEYEAYLAAEAETDRGEGRSPESWTNTPTC
jgi:hypothetical protein